MQTASDAYELSLSKLLLEFMKFTSLRGLDNFPPFQDKLWHYFLYLLKSEFEKKFPELKCIGDFNWDGVDPKCKDFDTAMFGIRYQCLSRTFGGRISLNPEINNTENLLEKHHPELAETMLAFAHQIPEFFSAEG